MEIFSLKPTVYFGHDALDALRQLNGKRILVVTDSFLSSSGLLDGVRARLKNSDITLFDQVTPDPSVELVARGVGVMEGCAPEAMIAFGGGSPMDCAKAMRRCAGRELPLWAVPTTAGTGSEMTAYAVLTDTKKGVKHPLADSSLLSDAAVLDPSLLESVPVSVTADTGMDVLTHAAEAYVAVGANPFTDALAEKAFVMAWHNLRGACSGEEKNSHRAAMLYASCLAGMAFNGAGLGICHSLAHALGGRIHMPHGRLNAMLLPRVIAFNANHEESARRYARLAQLCSLAGSARALSGAISRLLTALNMPRTLTVDDPAAVAETALADRCTASNPRNVSRADLENILRELSR